MGWGCVSFFQKNYPHLITLVSFFVYCQRKSQVMDKNVFPTEERKVRNALPADAKEGSSLNTSKQSIHELVYIFFSFVIEFVNLY